MLQSKLVIKNETGLHARPANDFVTFIKTLDSNVQIENETGTKVKATSLIKILSLGIKKDSKITIYCDGENERANLEKIEKFLNELKD